MGRFGYWGSGTSSLLFTGQDPASFNPTALIERIRYAIDRGVNYLDLGYPYDLKRHERIARMLGDRASGWISEKVRTSVTVGHPTLFIRQKIRVYLNEQLGWLDTDQNRFCLLGRLHRENLAVAAATRRTGLG